MTSGNVPSTGGSRRSPKRRSSSTAARREPARSRATSSIPCEESTPITPIPGERDRDRDPPGADAELDHRAAGAARPAT